MVTRVLVVVGGLFVLAIVAAIAISFLGNAGASFNKGAVLSVAQDQTEIARLSTTGAQDGVSDRVKNFSITTQLSMKSEQAEFQKYLASAGYKIDAKQLLLKQDAAASTALADAKSSSTFDTAYTALMQKKFQTYQADLKAAYEGASEKAKQQLSARYDAANLLLLLLRSTSTTN